MSAGVGGAWAVVFVVGWVLVGLAVCAVAVAVETFDGLLGREADRGLVAAPVVVEVVSVAVLLTAAAGAQRLQESSSSRS